MTKDKGKVIQMTDVIKQRVTSIQTKSKKSKRLRSNELNRLWALVNKMNWKRSLNKEDLRDLQEIESIQKGKVERIYPNTSLFLPAFPKSVNGDLHWFQHMEEEPIRQLDEREKKLWHQYSTHGFQGYVRTDGSIQAYVRSGRYDKDDEE